SYSYKDLNNESDGQDQPPLHMSITAQMAVCWTAGSAGLLYKAQKITSTGKTETEILKKKKRKSEKTVISIGCKGEVSLKIYGFK
ncbi:hypothetical protein KUCAC02_017669, partial [Chaenocephalus aceratus]